jgi:hypothetical protein
MPGNKNTTKCLCGAVEIHVANVSEKVGACHCGTCRKWGGGPLLAVDCGTDVSFTGEQHITSYNSSDWAERGFCSRCGTHLFYRVKQTGQYIMPAGLFEDMNYDFDHQIFIDTKPDFYSFENKTKNMTGEEVFAAFGPNAE